MAKYEDKVLHELDDIREYDNPMPGWLMAIWWGSLIFSAAYLIFYALSFGEGSMEAEYRGETQRALTAVQAHFDAHPVVPPSPAKLLGGAKDAAVLDVAAARFTRSCAACHGERAQGLIGPNLTDDRWFHCGSVVKFLQYIV
jgi:cytochrome c oxidase cbb3-type subunit 3